MGICFTWPFGRAEAGCPIQTFVWLGWGFWFWWGRGHENLGETANGVPPRIYVRLYL
jgi:hypothetical protein